jgi:hypothetical protein
VCGRYGQFARSWIALYMTISDAFSLSAPNREESRTRFISALRKSRERRVRTRIVQLDHYLALEMRGTVVAKRSIADAILCLR